MKIYFGKWGKKEQFCSSSGEVPKKSLKVAGNNI
jgi:hypothetical protein